MILDATTLPRWPVAAYLSYIAATFLFATNPAQATELTGKLPGKFEVTNSGEATYTIPFKVPVATGGVRPKLSLQYRHRAGTGIAGEKWTIDGLSRITRCRHTIAQDDEVLGVEFDYSDRFCLDGQRLVLVSGTYGVAGSTYRTEIESFRRIVAYGTQGNGPQYFIVTDRNGRQHRYGNYSQSSTLDSTTGTAIFWARNQIKDTRGNEINYFFSHGFGVGAMYLDEVDFTSNDAQSLTARYRLRFEYEPRPTSDRRDGYVFGQVWSKDYRLMNVALDGRNANSAWENISEYDLSYSTGISGRSQIVSIQWCSGDECLPATTFDWQDSVPGWDSASSSGQSSAGHSHPLVGDFNNDGLQDLFVVKNGKWTILRGSTTGFQVPINTNLVGSTVGGTQTFDFNGDGLTDLVSKGSDSKWHIYKSTGTSLVDINTGVATVPQNGFYAEDVDGDGRDDVVYRTINNAFLLLSNGTGFDTPAIQVITGGSGGPKGIAGFTTPSIHKQVDFDGDGRGDLLVRYKVGRGVFKWAAYRFDGAQFVPYHSFPNGAGRPRLVDVNGDRLIDAVYPVNGNWTYSVNTGKDFAAASGSAIPDANPGLAIFADYDVDGRYDLIRATSSAWIVHKSNGNGFSTSGISIGGPDPLNSAAIPMDVDGDDHTDLVLPYANLWEIRNHKSPIGDVISKVTDGFGNTFEPVYASTPQMTHYYNTGSITVTFPEQRFNAPFVVIDSLALSNGIGGTYTTNYKYWDALEHVQGRGFLGFRVIRKIDSRDGTYDQPYFQQHWPYTGLLNIEYFRQSEANNKNYRTVDPNYGQTILGSGTSARVFRRVESVTTTDYEVGGALNGLEVRKVLRNPVYETTYGNVTSEVTTTTSTLVPGDTYTTTKTYQYSNLTTPWCLGLPTKITISRSAPGAVTSTRKATNTFDSSTCQLLSSVNTSETSTALQLKTSFTYDDYGNVLTVIRDSANGAAADRKSEFAYDTWGQLPLSRADIISGATSPEVEWSWDYTLGQISSETDARGQTTGWGYDAFGRVVSEARPDGTTSAFSYTECVNCWVSGRGQFYIQQDDSDGFSARDYRDGFGRSIGGWSEMVTGAKSQSRVNYDIFGRVARQYVPWVAGESTYHIDYQYDLLGRLTQENRPVDEQTGSGAITSVVYQGLTRTVTDPENQTATYVTDPLGRMASVTDDLLGITEYDYTAFDQLQMVTDPADRSITIAYNHRGDRISFSDSDLGDWSYANNVFGELASQTDAKNQTTTFAYNQLGLPASRIEPEGTTTWSYFTSADYKLWLPSSVTAPGSFSETYAYDTLSRPSSTTTIIDGVSYTTNYAYHTSGSGKGKLKRITYPTSTSGVRFKVDYDYDQWGQLEKVKNGDSPSTVYYQLYETDAFGRQRLATLGNGLDEDRIYDRANGYLTAIETGPNLSAAVQNLSYEWDTVGNLARREDLNQNKTEDFTYDSLNRLKTVKLNSATTLTVNYNNVGNITYKSDVGTYSYATGSNAVSGVTGLRPGTYEYDANGNMIERDGDAISWYSYNLPKRIDYGGGVTFFL